MPIYEYECQSCRHRFEFFQKVTASPLKKCAQCSGKLEKVISPSGLMFKGSGWYVTDYSQKLKSKEDAKPKEDPKTGKGDQKQIGPATTKPDTPSGKKPSSK